MPNHITNRLSFEGSNQEVNRLLDFIKTDYGLIDFEKIVPMPDNIYRGDLGDKEKKLYGENNWYDWSSKNWGTKWNAYSQEFDEETNTLYFDTAWNGVPDLMYKLALKFPNITIHYAWADEDLGYNVGKITYKGKRYKEEEFIGGSKEAYELCFEIRRLDYKSFGYSFNEGTNTYEYDPDYDEE